MKDLEEGQKCPKCLTGILIYPAVVGCSCHINPPCSACTDNQLECDFCGKNEDELMMEE